ncbi:MAG: hypothetical protein HFI68_07570 [Lachnospiraceae bacterium]|nr:hypothetical protein [Lachnospiraceae bacterium]
MLPMMELIRNFVKKHPVLVKMKDTKVAKSVKDHMNQRYMDGRRAQVQKYGYEIIRLMNHVRKEMGAEIWIDWGTFLGYYREGKILGHDYDLDFSTWRGDEDFHQKLKDNVLKHHVQLVREFSLDGKVITETYCYKDILFDIEYYERDEKQVWTYSFDMADGTKVEQTMGKQVIRGMNLYIFYTDALDFKESAFANGVKCLVPVQEEKRIVELYGKDWRVPVKDYRWQDLKNYEFHGFKQELTGWRIK